MRSIAVLLLAASAASQSAPRPPTAIAKSVERELATLHSPKATWARAQEAAHTILALAKGDKQSSVARRVAASYIDRVEDPLTESLHLRILAGIPGPTRGAACEDAIRAFVAREARARKHDKLHVAEPDAIERVDRLLCFCGQKNRYALRNQVSREPLRRGYITLFSGLYEMIRSLSKRPHDAAFARRVQALLAGPRPQVKARLIDFLTAQLGRKPQPRMIEKITEHLAKKTLPDIPKQMVLRRQYADLSYTCPLLSAWERIEEQRPVPSIDAPAKELRSFLEFRLRDKHDAEFLALGLALLAARPDAPAFLTDALRIFENEAFPGLWRHDFTGHREVRVAALESRAIQKVWTARAIFHIWSASSSKRRSETLATVRNALQHLAEHGSERERAAVKNVLR